MTPAFAPASFPSKLKPFYSLEESSELMDIGIHSVISLQPPGGDNESMKVGAPGHRAGRGRGWKSTQTQAAPWAQLLPHRGCLSVRVG